MLARNIEARPLLPASFPLGRCWFVASVIGRMELKAASEIELLGFGAFCPMQSRQRIIRGRKVYDSKPVFPGYVFVQFDRERDDWGLIHSVRGIIDILKNGIFPSQVPDIIMERLQNMAAAGVFDKAIALTAGDNVEITEGPFAGLIAKVKSASPRKRVKILLGAMGAMTIDPCFLRKS